tara:strand:- start:2344 stop:3321 length:978 start_codon:yes stop_codon:yes gene_type:complete
MIYKQISSKAIIRKVMRDIKPTHSNWIDDAVEWIGEALEHIGANSQLTMKKVVLTIKEHKAILPTDLYYINQVAVNSTMTSEVKSELLTLTTLVKSLKDDIYTYQQDLNVIMNETIEKRDAAGKARWAERIEEYDTLYKTNVNELNEINSRIIVLEGMFFNVDGQGGNTLTPLKYGTSSFPKAIHCEDCINETANFVDSYIVDNDYIKTSFESGTVCLTYMAFPVDEECFPLVPDDISYKEALFWYIFKQMLLGGFDKPNNRVDYSFADQKWNKYCSQARANANFPNIDKMNSFMNQWVRLIPDLNQHSVMFESLGDRENLNRSM